MNFNFIFVFCSQLPRSSYASALNITSCTKSSQRAPQIVQLLSTSHPAQRAPKSASNWAHPLNDTCIQEICPLWFDWPRTIRFSIAHLAGKMRTHAIDQCFFAPLHDVANICSQSEHPMVFVIMALHARALIVLAVPPTPKVTLGDADVDAIITGAKLRNCRHQNVKLPSRSEAIEDDLARAAADVDLLALIRHHLRDASLGHKLFRGKLILDFISKLQLEGSRPVSDQKFRPHAVSAVVVAKVRRSNNHPVHARKLLKISTTRWSSCESEARRLKILHKSSTGSECFSSS